MIVAIAHSISRQTKLVDYDGQHEAREIISTRLASWHVDLATVERGDPDESHREITTPNFTS